jgi:hypothetical protein
MTQAQHTHTPTNALVPAAVGALAMAAILTSVMFVSGAQVTLPSFEQVTSSGVSAEVLQSGRDWEAQRLQQAWTGITANQVDMGILGEQDARRQAIESPGLDADGRLPTPPQLR